MTDVLRIISKIRQIQATANKNHSAITADNISYFELLSSIIALT